MIDILGIYTEYGKTEKARTENVNGMLNGIKIFWYSGNGAWIMDIQKASTYA
jgi:hypothetical protein